MTGKKYLTKASFESLLKLAAQPRKELKPASGAKEVGTLALQTSGDCSENRTHPGNSAGT
jgi:hypothetical protein